MRRRLLNLLTAASLLLCAAVAVVWLRSHFVTDWIDCLHVSDSGTATEFEADAECGVLCLKLHRFASGGPGTEWKWLKNRGPTNWPDGRLGFAFEDRWPRSRAVTLPLWLPCAVLVAMPPAWKWRRPRRAITGRCDSCGYDLTGNVSGVCPECGLGAAERV